MRSGVDQNFFLDGLGPFPSTPPRTVSEERARGIDVAQSELVVAFFPHTYVTYDMCMHTYTPKRSFGIFHFEVTVFILQLQLNVYVYL